MANDTPRDTTNPNRQAESPANQPYHLHFEALETHIDTLRQAVERDQTLEDDTKQTARRHCRELRAELEWLERELPAREPHDDADCVERNGAVTVVSGLLGPQHATDETAAPSDE